MKLWALPRDFATRARKLLSRLSPHHLLTLSAVVLGAGLLVAILPDDAGATRTDPGAAVLEPATGMDNVVIDSDLLAADAPTGEAEDEPADAAPPSTAGLLDDNWLKAAVREGDNLSLIFGRNGVSSKDLQQIMALGGETDALRKIFPGTEVRLQIGADGRLNGLAYPLGEARELRVERTDDGFTATTIEHEVEHRIVQASGVIQDSLFMSANRAGLSDNLTMELASVFAYDIDFSLDIRENDRFSVVYDEVYLHGEKLRDGHILAAEFVNRGKTFRAVRYTDPDGNADYYSPEGQTLRKAFLRSPVVFTRISSRFSLGRYHPVLNLIRAHKGVDYAAPTGTPVKVTGDGKVIFKGTNGGYGNVVVIQHGSRYSTLYGHLSAFGRIAQGQRVRQGQVIGYVGMTGLATGPHLHYEFRVDGVHRDPLTVKLPNAEPIARRLLEDFSNHARPLLAQLDSLDATQVSEAAVQDPAPRAVAIGAR